MRKTAILAAFICAVFLINPFTKEGIALAITQHDQRLTSQEAIARARSNQDTKKPGDTYSVLMDIPSNAETRRVGDQALAQASAKHIKLYENGILADMLRSGGFLIAQIDPRTKSVVMFHWVSLGRDGVPQDLPTGPGDNLADTQELFKDTTELVEQLYSMPSTEESSLENRFYGGSFPDGDQGQDTLFAIPHSLQKLGADPNEVQRAAALYGGYLFWQFRYALSMPVFAASPLAALIAAGYKEEALQTAFLRSHHMDPKLDLDLGNIRSKGQLRKRIELLTRLNKFLENALKNVGNRTVIRANLSLVTMPIGVGATSGLGQGIYESATPSMFEFYWQRLPTGGFAIKYISEADPN